MCCTLVLFTLDSEEMIMTKSVATREIVSDGQYCAMQCRVPQCSLMEIFDFQVSVLREKGLDLPREDVNRLRAFVPAEEAYPLFSPRLFLVVPRRPDVLDLDGLMGLVGFYGVSGENVLVAEHVFDITSPVNRSHLLLSVDDGYSRRNTPPQFSSEAIASEGRIPYSVWYGIIHAILFPFALRRSNLELMGSYYKEGGSADYMPDIRISGSAPILDRKPVVGQRSSDYFGVPSAGGIIGA